MARMRFEKGSLNGCMYIPIAADSALEFFLLKWNRVNNRVIGWGVERRAGF